ncbi:wall-associated receptor kinase-like 1 isoform X2 [Quercus robur]|uniref:wall-associated receptor kinase-like 1 isoform X2 n=1 Tax=Quercus robur TaxID=38942 RepID=UPI002161B646|nr:wall-associated receptor kinase-like 1 isoform X2 [Quercus robur]
MGTRKRDMGMTVGMVVLLWSMNVFTKAVGLGNSSCSGAAAVCGNVTIPYPFGIEPGCYIDDWFAIGCNNTLGSPKPFLRRLDLEVLDISLEGTLRVNYPMSWWCPRNETKNATESAANVSLASSPFFFSKSRNIFIAMGCGNLALLRSSDGSIGGCMSVCYEDAIHSNASSCNGLDCCKTTIPSDLDVFTADVSGKYGNFTSAKDCNYGSLVDQKWFEENLTNHIEVKKMSQVPVVLNWEINESLSSLVMETNSSDSTCQLANGSSLLGNMSTTFTCTCDHGFEGNPYLVDGCQDIDECTNLELCNFYDLRYHCVNVPGRYYCDPVLDHKSRNKIIIIGISTGIGLLFLFIGGWWSYKVVKKRKNIKRKEKFFKRNGGLLLQQQLSSSEVTVEKTTKLFNSKDLEKATDNFNVNRILGQGGQGTVYKGMLTDGKIVAVKKSKVIDEGKLEEFINEVVILSQINHRNVVKLHGCCLETEVPLLVYEFIPNGTLSQYLYDQNEEFLATWDMRLQIATEVAGALFYLHSAASTPIYHRDIKTTNILLDDKYRAKVADFGTSRSIAVDQTHLTTIVQGTFGYLDPEYFQSSQFTEKSDVYSFGVVLVELLTGEKAISSTRTKECRSLATYLIHSMEENNLFDIIDARVMKDAKQEEIIAVANLAKMCLNLNRKERPIMKEVTKQLEAIQTLQKTPNVQQTYEEVEYVRTEMYEQWDDVSTSTMSGADSGLASTSGSRPLLSF